MIFSGDVESRLDPDEFNDVLIIKFDSLSPREYRTIHVPIYCSDNLQEDLETQVSFLGVFIDSLRLQDYYWTMKN